MPYIMTPSVTTHKILVVDDDAAIRQLIARFLGYGNYQVATAETAAIARQRFTEFAPDLVILDVNLPDDSGFNLCKEMRAHQTLVLMLTCLTDRDDILAGFEQGADEYLTKPFDLDVLKAKIGALLKRQQPIETTRDNGNLLKIGRLLINNDRCEVTCNGELVPLTFLEYELFYFLATHPEKVWGRKELITEVWAKQKEETVERKVDVHIGQIRRKIGDPDNDCIRTIRGKGYVFEKLPS
jgi:DNA-binding response OmpR family regulator